MDPARGYACLVQSSPGRLGEARGTADEHVTAGDVGNDGRQPVVHEHVGR